MRDYLVVDSSLFGSVFAGDRQICQGAFSGGVYVGAF